jgi:HK97 family phage major capsid protein
VNATEAREAFETRARHVANLRSLMERVAAREMTSDEERQSEDLERQIEDIDTRLRAYHEAQAGPRPTIDPHGQAAPEARYGRPLAGGQSFRTLPGAGAGSGDAEAFGAHLQAIYEGRAQNEGTGSAGGFLVPTTLAAGVLDLVVSGMGTHAAGARIVPMDSQTLKVAKVDGRPTPAWRNESAIVTESSATFGQVEFQARSAAVLVKASVESLQDAPSLGETVQRSLADAFAVELDRVGLLGTGVAPEPLGLKAALPAGNTTSLGTDGAVPSYADVIGAVATIRGRGYNPRAVILSTRDDAAIRTDTDTAGQFIAAPAYLSDVTFRPSAAVPTDGTQGLSTDAADIFVGDFSHLAYGIRSAFSITPLRERYLAESGEIGFVAMLRADVAVLRDDAFQIVSGAIGA